MFTTSYSLEEDTFTIIHPSNYLKIYYISGTVWARDKGVKRVKNPSSGGIYIQVLRSALTCCFHKGFVQPKRQKGFFEVSKEIFQKAADGMDIIYFAEKGYSFHSEEFLFQLFYCPVTA